MAVIVPMTGIMGQDFIIGRLVKEPASRTENYLLAGARLAMALPRLRRGLPVVAGFWPTVKPATVTLTWSWVVELGRLQLRFRRRH